ncbi:MAG TPA: choice-of-anchor M domain-containing protein, partial [Rhodoglobus sp.]|nr:choice-of-anchor M domain-containing protein [Rhodoglobus sp.]
MLGNVHTDAVTTYLDEGRLVLGSQADVDGELRKRLPSASLIFNLDGGRTTVPPSPAYAFLGSPGQEVWLAPQTQNAALIWPGFSTEHGSLRGALTTGGLDVELVEVEGPGAVQLYLQETTGPRHVFSSDRALPPWRISDNQHVHMNWVFGAQGRYELTFRQSGLVNGTEQSAQTTYVFHVGDMAGYPTQPVSTSLEADREQLDPGQAVRFDAAVEPAGAEGSIEFRDAVTGTLLGSTPVVDGRAGFATDRLTSGPHEIVARFVPTWSTEFHPSESQPVPVRVSGDAEPMPQYDDTTPATDEALAALTPADRVVVDNDQRTVEAGGTVLARAAGLRPGEWVSVWRHGPAPVWVGWQVLDAAGRFAFDLGDEAAAGTHRLVVETADGVLVGWDRFAVRGEAGGGGGVVPPPPPPVQPPPPSAGSCAASNALVLSSGHVDFSAIRDAFGGFRAVVKEDVSGPNTMREPSGVVFWVGPQAATTLPDRPAYGAVGAPGSRVWLIPQTQRADIVWLGWNTEFLLPATDVRWTLDAMEGPGEFVVYRDTAFGDAIDLIMSSSSKHSYVIPTNRDAQGNATRGAHVHGNWVFTEQGVYRLTFTYSATLDGRTVSDTETLTIAVGDVDPRTVAPSGGCGAGGARLAAAVAPAVAVD